MSTIQATDDFRAAFTAIALAAAKAGPGGYFVPSDAREFRVDVGHPNTWGRAWRFWNQQGLCRPVAVRKAATVSRKRSNEMVYTLTERGIEFIEAAIASV